MESHMFRPEQDIKAPRADPSADENGMVSIFNTHIEAETAIKEMQSAGFDMKKLSIVGKDYQTQENIVGFYNLGDRVKLWGQQGAFWGGLWGLLLGSAFFVIPGVGPIVVAGHFAMALVGVLEGAVVFGGLSAIGAALYSLGIEKNSVVRYEADIKAGKFMLIAHGTTSDLRRAREIAKNAGGQNSEQFGRSSSKEGPEDFSGH